MTARFALVAMLLYGQIGKDGARKVLVCQHRTREGKQCKRKASTGSQFCWQHGASKKKKTAVDLAA
ncbi:MAG TPA: hypothetical protein VM120_30170 [Bryobacteraceae bacterium]|nr:hypothetical protein [Bryobacteraceae bacterium]